MKRTSKENRRQRAARAWLAAQAARDAALARLHQATAALADAEDRLRQSGAILYAEFGHRPGALIVGGRVVTVDAHLIVSYPLKETAA